MYKSKCHPPPVHPFSIPRCHSSMTGHTAGNTLSHEGPFMRSWGARRPSHAPATARYTDLICGRWNKDLGDSSRDAVLVHHPCRVAHPATGTNAFRGVGRYCTVCAEIRIRWKDWSDVVLQGRYRLVCCEASTTSEFMDSWQNIWYPVSSCSRTQE